MASHHGTRSSIFNYILFYFFPVIFDKPLPRNAKTKVKLNKVTAGLLSALYAYLSASHGLVFHFDLSRVLCLASPVSCRSIARQDKLHGTTIFNSQSSNGEIRAFCRLKYGYL